MCCAHRLVHEQTKEQKCCARMHTSKPESEKNTCEHIHTDTLTNRVEHPEDIFSEEKDDYFNVFEQERALKRRKGKCFVNGPRFDVEKFCECFGEIEHDELPSIDDDGDDE